MKEVSVYVYDRYSNKKLRNFFIENPENLNTFAQEDRTIDELVNSGEMDYMNFVGFGPNCTSVHNPCMSQFFCFKKIVS